MTGPTTASLICSRAAMSKPARPAATRCWCSIRDRRETIPATSDERESMARNVLILGASYGSLLATKLLMAGHNVTLVCRNKTAELINRDGTEGRVKLRDEAMHRAIF